MIALTGHQLQHWTNHTTANWKRLIAAHPQILTFPCSIRETQNVAQLLQHIVAVELRYAELLNDRPQTSYDDIPYHSADALFATHDSAMRLLTPLLDRDDAFWDFMLEMQTRSAGVLCATRRTVFVHLHTHSIRHYAQLATISRTHGIPPDWYSDYILLPPAS